MLRAERFPNNNWTTFFSDAQRAQDSLEGGVEKLEHAVETLNVRLARLLAEYSASQAKLKQRIAKLEFR